MHGRYSPAIVPGFTHSRQHRSGKQNTRPTKSLTVSALPGKLRALVKQLAVEFAEFKKPHAAFAHCGPAMREAARRLREAGFDAMPVGLDLRDYPAFYGEPEWNPKDHGVVLLRGVLAGRAVFLDYTARQFAAWGAYPLLWSEPDKLPVVIHAHSVTAARLPVGNVKPWRGDKTKLGLSRYRPIGTLAEEPHVHIGHAL